jgi:hypothetical protein
MTDITYQENRKSFGDKLATITAARQKPVWSAPCWEISNPYIKVSDFGKGRTALQARTYGR